MSEFQKMRTMISRMSKQAGMGGVGAEGSEADEDAILEGVEEEGHDWFWDNNYDSWDAEHFFGLPLQVDEVDPDNRYNLRF